LRYLFPLMTLGFVMTCFYRAAAWKRVLVFLSTIPIAILMNSFRVGMIGVTVEHWGPALAQGTWHEFQGWLVFMGSLGLLLLVMLLLGRIGTQQRRWREIFVVDWPRDVPPRVLPASPVLGPLALTVALIAAYSLVVQFSGSRVEAKPDRAMLAAFPDRLGTWSGQQVRMEPIYLETLKLDDYLLADFSENGGMPVNLYVAWYDSQRAGQAAHSPRSCLPGGGWRIEELDRVAVPGVAGPDGPLHVNRALISTGRDRGLVYYWFQQRGRVVTNEYLVKWYLFVDSLTRNRTDGALVRLTTPVAEGEDVAEADARLQGFAAVAVPELSRYVAE
jgi:exosortase D (VPLPA-CTERM-specific)